MLDTENIVLESVSILQPIILAKDQTKMVQIVLTPEESGHNFQIFSMNTPQLPSRGDSETSMLHATGKLRGHAESPLERGRGVYRRIRIDIVI